MNSLSKSFEPQEIESYWRTAWENRGIFQAGTTEGAAPFCIQLPPPNVTGTLHMGHAFNQTLMDTLTRWHRMQGHNTLWLPGTDHAGIATQIVVERQLDAQGLSRQDLGRERFLEKVWQWKEQSGSSITGQMRRIGASCDWSLEYFTMNPGLSKIVTEVFISLYHQGLIYRGNRLVNWDPELLTAVSDLEVLSEEEEGQIWEIAYPVCGSNQRVVVATTRPETMLGDVAVAVHPEDARYTHLVGKKLRLPIVGREIPVIADSYVDPAFGTGCVKITPAHDFNDYAIGQRHGLEMINIFTLDARINDAGPPAFQGLDRYAARESVLKALTADGFLVSAKPHTLMVPRGDRTGAVIEPMLTSQWFVAMSKPAPEGTYSPGKSIAARALEVVDQGEVRFFPENWTTTYRQWLENIQDWCISRQLWWGHQIPAWYKADEHGQAIEDGTVFVADTETKARELAVSMGWSGPIIRDPDVLDTWFSSALVPFSTLVEDGNEWDPSAGKERGLAYGGPRLRSNLAQYLPSSVLVTGFDIIFFWVARMVMMTCHFTGQVPFRDVYVHALVRDAEGQKMSKSKGNTLDPIDLIDGIALEALVQKRTSGLMNPKQAAQIEKKTRKEYPNGIAAFGTDALRFTFASLATPGRNINFDLSRCEGYRNFCNKLWNASRFVLMNCEDKDCGLNVCAGDCGPDGALHFSFVDKWIVSELQRTEAEVHHQLSQYRFDLAAKALYEFVWNEFCDWYLELAKNALQGPAENAAKAARRTLLRVLEATLRLAHPIIPFVTEALWQAVAPVAQKSTRLLAGEDDSIATAPYPLAELKKIDPVSDAQMAELKALVGAIRSLRSEMGLGPADRVPLRIGLDDLIRETSGSQTPATTTAIDYQGHNYDQAVALAALKSLGRLSDVEVVTAVRSEGEESLAPVQIVGSLRLMLRVAVDTEAERARIEKEIARIQEEIRKAQAKLDNPQFVDRAPEAIVQQERERLIQFIALSERVATQKRAIESL